MKTLLKSVFVLFSLLALHSCIVSEEEDGDAKFGSASKVMKINVPMTLAKPFIKNALREDGENEELIQLIKKVRDVKVTTVENGNPELLTQFSKNVTAKNAVEWMTIKKDKELINFRAIEKGDLIKNLLITIHNGTELTFVDVQGKFSPDDISKIINYSKNKDLKKVVKDK